MACRAPPASPRRHLQPGLSARLPVRQRRPAPLRQWHQQMRRPRPELAGLPHLATHRQFRQPAAVRRRRPLTRRLWLELPHLATHRQYHPQAAVGRRPPLTRWVRLKLQQLATRWQVPLIRAPPRRRSRSRRPWRLCMHPGLALAPRRQRPPLCQNQHRTRPAQRQRGPTPKAAFRAPHRQRLKPGQGCSAAVTPK